MYRNRRGISLIIVIPIFLMIGTYVSAKAAAEQQTPLLLWADEFDGSALDTRWARCFWWSDQNCTIESNHELELYTANNVWLENGTLRFQSRVQDPAITWCGRYCRDYPYTSGMAMTGGNNFGTEPLFTFQYGYIEARIKIPSGKGLWPAFWLLPTTYNSLPEIDIMEILGDAPHQLHMNFHPKIGKNFGCVYEGIDLSKDFHTYGVDWQTDYIAWYLDGAERCRYTGDGIPAEKMYILLNLAVGGDWPGAPDAETVFPADMFVDYVRVYSSRPETTPLTPPTQTATTPSPTLPSATLVPTSTPTNTLSPTPVSTEIPSVSYGYVQLMPSDIQLNETAQVAVGLVNVPAEGYSGAEFACSYTPGLIEISEVLVTDLFGNDPVVAMHGPQNGAFIVAVAGSLDKKAMTDGTVFTFRAKGLQPGQTNLECKLRVSKEEDILTSLPSQSAQLTIGEHAPSPTSEPTIIAEPTITPTLDILPAITNTPPSTGLFTGQVKASKPVTLQFYAPDNTLLQSQTVNHSSVFFLQIPPGTYLLRITASGFLSAQGDINLIPGQTFELPPLALFAGDIDGNQVIDQFDALTIGMSYNTAFPETADLNSDQVINLLDLKLLARNYRKSGPSSW